jgi:hypothetical protein
MRCVYICMVRSYFFIFVIQRDIITSIKFSVAFAGICLKDSYVYITQQDAPHKDKKPCNLLKLNRHFGVNYRLLLQDTK